MELKRVDGVQVLKDDICHKRTCHCKSISIEREKTCFAGIVKVDTEEYEKEKREYDSFWEWMANRNEARYSNDWDSEGKVDRKNLMHKMRLMLCAESIARTGVPTIRFDGEGKQYLMDIRNGKFSYESIMKNSEDMMLGMKALFDASNLPHGANFDAINNFYISTMKAIIKEGGR